MVVEEALFRSVESALKFAYSEQYADLPQSPVSRMASTPSRSGNGLGGLDGYAQAGMILARVGTVSELHRAILTARFSPAIGGECPHCSGGVLPNLRWLAAVAWISEFVGAEVPCTLPFRRLREGSVSKYFGDRSILLNTIGDRCGLHRNTVSKHNSAIVTALKVREAQARFEIRAMLEASGVVAT